MTKTDFNIIDQPWIPVIYCDGVTKDVSIREFFADAHKIRTLNGEIPTQNVSTLRFLLAIVYAIITRHDVNGVECMIFDEDEAFDRWDDYWKMSQFDMNVFNQYFQIYYNRFFLFHPDRPFYQYNIKNGSKYGAEKLMGDISKSGHKPRLFVCKSGEKLQSMTYSEAVRWLIHLIGYDDASLKPYSKDTNGEKLPPAKVGWIGRLGIIYLVGNNMFQTLMLNLVLTTRSGEPFPNGKTVWEDDDVIIQERREVPIPNNPLVLLTIPSRRVLLKEKDGFVTGYVEIVGDQFSECCSDIESMTMWRKKDDDWVPKAHIDASKAAWRDYSAMLVKADDKLVPGVIDWQSKLIKRGVTVPNHANIFVVGVSYSGGPTPSAVENIFCDNISVNSNILRDLDKGWTVRVDSLLLVTDECMKAYGTFIRNSLIAKGIDANDDLLIKTRVESSKLVVYDLLDRPFRQWLSTIDVNSIDYDRKCSEWYESFLKPIIKKSAQEIIESSSPTSFMRIKNKDGRVLDESIILEYNKMVIRINRSIRGD